MDRTARMIACELGISKQRVFQYIESGHLRANVVMKGRQKVMIVPEEEWIRFKNEHYLKQKKGRPRKYEEGFNEWRKKQSKKYKKKFGEGAR